MSRALVAALLAAMLAACGGGDPEDNPLPDEHDKCVPHVDPAASGAR